MQSQGYTGLLSLPKVGFLAASHVPSDEVMRCYDWAVQLAGSEQCVVSGFSSRLERDVLHFLLKGTCPIIVVLARRMYKAMPEEWQPAIDKGRMLIISTSDASRQSRQTAQLRNQYVAEISDIFYLVGAIGTSTLCQLQQLFPKKFRHITTDKN